jgi:hypothetical protein
LLKENENSRILMSRSKTEGITGHWYGAWRKGSENKETVNILASYCQ